MSPQRIGIVAGLPAEIAAFRPDHPGDRAIWGGLPVRTLDLGGRQVLLACDGIGKVAAAHCASVLAIAGSVDLLLVIGTAGKIGRRGEQLFRIVRALQTDYGARHDDRFVHYEAGKLPIGASAIKFFEAMHTSAPDLPEAVIATNDCFIESQSHATYLHEMFQADLVDMETAAVAQIAASRGLPWCAIKATTDNADEASADAFQRNLDRAAQMAAEAAEALILSL